MSASACQHPESPLVTIAIPVLNEASLLPGLLTALRMQTWPREAMQVIFVDGGSEDDTLPLIRSLAETFPQVLILDNPKRVAAAGLNVALQHARGIYFLRLDARSRPAPDYIERCVDYLQTEEWMGVSGPQIACSREKKGEAIALALNHPIGAGNPSYRRTRIPTTSDTLYLGAYPTSLLRELQGWREQFAANEDYELNHRIRKRGGRLLVAPDIHIRYIARDRLRELFSQYARYGAWRVETLRLHPRAIRFRHLAPAVWSAALGLSLLALPISPWPIWLILLPYLFAITLASMHVTLFQHPRLFFRVWLAFPVMHLGWGIGFWRRLLTRKLPCAIMSR